MSKKGGRAPNPAFMKPLTPNAILAAIIGPEPRPRTQINKDLWAYIKSKGLQDPANKREIIADDKLRAFFGKDRANMFELGRFIKNHTH